MASVRPKCGMIDCFQNKCGARCELLTAPPTTPCPFYKTMLEADIGRQEAHKKLADAGRFDLIEKYEYNSQRRGQW